MARNNILYPQVIGHPDGPCSMSCSCIICIIKRKHAARLCKVCHEPIGFGRGIYYTDKSGGAQMHADCLHDELTIKVSEIGARVLAYNQNTEPVEDEALATLRRAEIERAAQVARLIQAFLDGRLTNDTYNGLHLGREIQPSVTRCVRKTNMLDRIEEARKVDGVKKRGTRRGALIGKPEDEPTEYDPSEQGGAA